MEISFKWPSFYLCLLCFQLCNGNPITPSVTEIDSHTKVLTGIISLLLTICCLVFLAACLCCQRRKNFEVQDTEKKFRNSPVIASSTSDIDHGHINPIANGEFTIFTPLSSPHFNNNIVHANDDAKARIVEDSVENCYDIRSWFGTIEKDFPRNKLKYIRELGTGWFGKVVQGAAQDVNDSGQSWTPVVVRILDATSSQKEKILFLQDAAIYRCSCHTNILSLVGRSLETVPFLLLQEYCPQGDLKGYLQSNKIDAEKLLSTEYPLIWCCQLTSAVKHIHENNIIHLDLASRNCQLTSNLTLKLGDYGLGPFKYPADYYQGLSTVPVRWCAPESLVCTHTTIQPKKITPEANVWSLGVTMWEICECGQQPYKVLSDDEVITQVLGSSNIRLGRPTYSALYTDYIFRLMQSCWTSVESRPTVSQINLMLTDLLQVHRNTTYNTLDIGEFDRRWESSKPNTLIKTDHITEALVTSNINIKKPLSLSLNNLHGSLDNLADETKLFIENETINDSLTSHRTSISDFSDQETSTKKIKTEFLLNSNSLFQRTTSSGSETEEENWRNKVERGAYTEKVRQKSKSVTDLMILTHVDYSESEPDTSLPSLDYRVNYKNVRMAGLEGPNNLENASLTFGSEGNLLSLQDTFQEELRKLHEERRDSLPFVPDTVSQNSFSNKELSNVASPSKLMQELNSPVDIKPANQVFNVYNVTIENFSPVKAHCKLEEIIDFNAEMNKEMREVDCKKSFYDMNGSDSCDNLNEDSSYANLFKSNSEFEHSLSNDCEAVNLNAKIGSEYIRSDTLNLQEHENACNGFKVDKDIAKDVDFNPHFKLNISQNLDNMDNKHTEIDVENTSTTFEKSENVINPDYNPDSKEKYEDLQNMKNRNTKMCGIEVEQAINSINKTTENIMLPQFEIENRFIAEKIVVAIIDQILEAAVLKISSNEKKIGQIHIENNKNKTTDVINKSLVDNIKALDENYTKEMQTKPTKINEDNENKKGTKDLILQSVFTKEADLQQINQVPKLSDIILCNKNLAELLDKIGEEENVNSPVVNFDLSLGQKEAMPNSLTHSTLFTSTPFRKREISLPSKDKFSSLNLFSTDENEPEKNSFADTSPLNYSLETWDNFLGTTLDNQNEQLENMFDSFSSEPQSLLFIEAEKCVGDNEENNKTQVLLKSDCEPDVAYNLTGELNATYNLNNGGDTTYNLNNKTFNKSLNATYKVEENEAQNTASNNEIQRNTETSLNSTYFEKKPEDLHYNSIDANEGFENGGGWFLHPQPTNDLCGDIQIQSPNTDTYIGFGIDDEIMSAIRNELLNKLPHAQGANANRVKEEEDWDTCDRNEVFLRYNVYNTPLSPIPEESIIEDGDGSPINSPKLYREYEDADWSGRTDTDTLTHEIESNSAHTLESPLRGQFNRHTPSQDSCCSNDTLFNLEELICATTDLEKDLELPLNLVTDIDEINLENTFLRDSNPEVKSSTKIGDNITKNAVDSFELCYSNKTFINEFLLNERNHSIDSNQPKQHVLNINFQSSKQVVPLPSPEDNPWKQLPASLLNFKNVTTLTNLSLEETQTLKNNFVDEICVDIENSDKENTKLVFDTDDASLESKTEKSKEQNLTFSKNKPDILQISPLPTSLSKMASLSNIQSIDEESNNKDAPLENDNFDKENIEPFYENSELNEIIYENEKIVGDGTCKDIEQNKEEKNIFYENTDVLNTEIDCKNASSEIDSYEDYVTIVNMENDKNRLECEVDKDIYINIYGHGEEVHSEDDNIYGILTDIRFTGPTDNQLMSTSFSENNDEQGWESGSDSRSSSSGEFIWKEGEHEESLKALRAAPQDVLENIKPMEGIAEDNFEESDVSSSFTDDEENPEFVPSAWDKFAIPSKSALRSPEKTLNKSEEKKTKGVWFKKQKYHCIYEYPKEPESPVLQSQDLWKPQTDLNAFADWEFDGEVFVPSQATEETPTSSNKPNSILSNQNLYHLTSITDFIPENSNSTNSEDEFLISSSTQPFQSHSLSSQFFPGSTSWTFENATPDSGVEDITPGSVTDSIEFGSTTLIPTLKQLASEAVAKKKILNLRNSEVMGGLRHTRNKLKLDLPPSPSAFTSDKPFTIEPTVEHVIREKPAFTTFGKSRFMVQHVDTPPDETKSKNVSFEALPYHPFNPVIKNYPDPIKAFDCLERSLIKNEEDDTCKLQVEVVRGEASLLDSGDEDSGIESASTLERKVTNSQV